MTGNAVENVLLITYDSLRYDVWNELQESLVAGPKLEAEGLHFSRAFATGPGTTPSFPGMLTGTLPLSYGGLGPLTSERPCVASELRGEGFATGGFHSNPFLSTHFNYDTGFDEFRDYQNPLMGVATKIFPRGIEINNPKLERVDDVLHITDLLKSAYRLVSDKARPYVSAEVITDDSIEWLEQTDEPFFCWSHYMDVHHPCHPPAKERAEFGVEHVDIETVSELYSKLLDDSASLTDSQLQNMRDLYRVAIVYVDRQIDRLLQTLESAGRLENTLVVLTSDHGELFGEHGAYGKPERMYDELIQVPLIVLNGPSELEQSTDELVSLLDLPPLFHETVGIDIPDSYEGQYPGSSTRDHIVAEHEVSGDPIVGVRSANWLYEIDNIHDERYVTDIRTWEELDPTQRVDSELERVKQLAEDRIARIGAETEPEEAARLEADVEARLENLGYR